MLHPRLVEALREFIIRGEVLAGQKVPEAALCERFAVSRTPMREALKVLAAEGMVELLPNRGARVRTLTVEEVEGLFSVAGAFEALAGEQASARITESELAALQALHDEMRACFNRRDLAPYYALNRRIHEAMIQATRNPVLVAQYGALNARISRIRFASPMSEDIWARAMAEHEGMQNALMRRDGAALSSILKTHLKHKCEAILKSMATAPPPDDGQRPRAARRPKVAVQDVPATEPQKAP